MGIKSITLKDAATSMTVVGGSDQVFTEDGVVVPNGVHVAAASVADFRVRPHIGFRSKVPTFTNGVYSKSKRWITYTQPKILADGSTVFNLFRSELEVHPETTEAEVIDLLMKSGQVSTSTASRDFLTKGSLA